MNEILSDLPEEARDALREASLLGTRSAMRATLHDEPFSDDGTAP